MDNHLEKFVNTTGMTPEQAMRMLAAAHVKLMTARLKAYSDGLMAIHDTLAKVCDQVTKKQDALLLANPELVLMVF